VETLPRLTGLDSVRVLAIPEEDATVRKMIAECMCLRAAQFIAALQLEPADHCGHAHLDAEHSTETVQGAPASAKVRKLLDLTNDALSRRELEVLDLLLQGDRKTQVARKLHISVFTVRNHVKAIYRKLRVSSHEELLSAAPRDQYALRITAAT
jgi:DNA-binding NarL/FixJ family response regulator